MLQNGHLKSWISPVDLLLSVTKESKQFNHNLINNPFFQQDSSFWIKLWFSTTERSLVYTRPWYIKEMRMLLHGIQSEGERKECSSLNGGNRYRQKVRVDCWPGNTCDFNSREQNPNCRQIVKESKVDSTFLLICSDLHKRRCCNPKPTTRTRTRTRTWTCYLTFFFKKDPLQTFTNLSEWIFER